MENKSPWLAAFVPVLSLQGLFLLILSCWIAPSCPCFVSFCLCWFCPCFIPALFCPCLSLICLCLSLFFLCFGKNLERKNIYVYKSMFASDRLNQCWKDSFAVLIAYIISQKFCNFSESLLFFFSYNCDFGLRIFKKVEVHLSDQGPQNLISYCKPILGGNSICLLDKIRYFRYIR